MPALSQPDLSSIPLDGTDKPGLRDLLLAYVSKILLHLEGVSQGPKDSFNRKINVMNTVMNIFKIYSNILVLI